LGDFEDSELRVSGLEIEPKYSGGRPANGGELQKVSAGSLHRTPWDRDKHTAHGASLILPHRREVKYSTTEQWGWIQK
jgi:hypothetical protein